MWKWNVRGNELTSGFFSVIFNLIPRNTCSTYVSDEIQKQSGHDHTFICALLPPSRPLPPPPQRNLGFHFKDEFLLNVTANWVAVNILSSMSKFNSIHSLIHSLSNDNGVLPTSGCASLLCFCFSEPPHCCFLGSMVPPASLAWHFWC